VFDCRVSPGHRRLNGRNILLPLPLSLCATFFSQLDREADSSVLSSSLGSDSAPEEARHHPRLAPPLMWASLEALGAQILKGIAEPSA
jgi:hypothetical protein